MSYDANRKTTNMYLFQSVANRSISIVHAPDEDVAWELIAPFGEKATEQTKKAYNIIGQTNDIDPRKPSLSRTIKVSWSVS